MFLGPARYILGVVILLFSLPAMPSGLNHTTKTPESVWIADSSSVPEHTVIRKGKSLLMLPLLPASLVSIREDATDKLTGDTRSVAGRFFFLNDSEPNSDTYCSTQPYDRMVTKTLAFASNSEFICFVDNQRDGTFDSWYRKQSLLRSPVPFLPTGQTDPDGELNTTHYDRASSDQFDKKLLVSLIWKSGSVEKGGIWLDVRFDTYDNKVRYSVHSTPWLHIPTNGQCGNTMFMNLTIDVCATDGGLADVHFTVIAKSGFVRVRGMSLEFGKTETTH